MFRSSLYDSHAGRCANDIYYNVDVIRACFIAAYDRRFCDGGMLFQRAFYFKWAYAIASADNYIIGATYEPEVAILVFISTVASDVPIAANAGLRCIWVAPVFFEHPSWTLRLDF